MPITDDYLKTERNALEARGKTLHEINTQRTLPNDALRNTLISTLLLHNGTVAEVCKRFDVERAYVMTFIDNRAPVSAHRTTNWERRV